MGIGGRIKKLREAQNLTQHNLAIEMDMSIDMIKSVEINRANPSIETLIKLCNFFGCTSDYILGIEKGKRSKAKPQERLSVTFEVTISVKAKEPSSIFLAEDEEGS